MAFCNIKTLTLEQLLAARPHFLEEELLKERHKIETDVDPEIVEMDRRIAYLNKEIATVNEKNRVIDARIEKSHRRQIIGELIALEYSGIPAKIAKSEPFMAEMLSCPDVPTVRERLTEFEEMFTRNPGSLNYNVSRYSERH